jgi:hypothetical protein
LQAVLVKLFSRRAADAIDVDVDFLVEVAPQVWDVLTNYSATTT